MSNRQRKLTEWLFCWEPSRVLLNGLPISSAFRMVTRLVLPSAGGLILALAASCRGEESIPANASSPPYAELESPGIVSDWLGERSSDVSSGVSITGWLQQGFTWNPASPADRYNGYVTNNDRANEWQMNQAFVTIARDVDLEGDERDVGFHIDTLYGTDGIMFSSLGWDDHTVSDTDSRFYKLAIPQLYADVFLPVADGLRIQLGKWSTLVGYEYGFGARDFFYSRSLGFNLTPYTHTGALATVSISDQLSVASGIHRGNDVVEDNNNNLSYIGCLTWTSDDESWTLYGAVNTGPEQDERADWQDLDGAPGPDAPGENLFQTITTVTLLGRLSDRWSIVVNNDVLYQQGSQSGSVGAAEAYGGSIYVAYDVSAARRWGLRLEVMRDDDGFITPGQRSGSAGAPGLYSNLSLGLNQQLSRCTVIRPEIRWDWQDRDNIADTPAFDDGTSSRQFLAAIDLVSYF